MVSTDARFDSPRAVQVRFSGFDLPKLAKLGGAIRDLHASGSGAETRIAGLVDDAYIGDLARGVAGELGGQVGVAPRVFLRKLVADVLDRVAEFPDFDPRQHYKLTLSATELTDVERNAAACRPSCADEVELEL
ncbi:MAG: BREX system ATP-binding domain-containing protein [Streptosporangiaceae bacterium]